jgi:hypothetical protein
MTISVTNSNISLETSALTGRGLLLHRHDLHDFVPQSVHTNEVIHNLELLDREREQENFFDRLDLSILYETAKLGNRDPLLLLALITTTATPAATTATVTTSSSTAKASTSISSVVSHFSEEYEICNTGLPQTKK